MELKQLKKKVLVKHTDGITGVVAKVFIRFDVTLQVNEITLEYRFEGMHYAQVIETEQAIKYGIVELIENKELVNN